MDRINEKIERPPNFKFTNRKNRFVYVYTYHIIVIVLLIFIFITFDFFDIGFKYIIVNIPFIIISL